MLLDVFVLACYRVWRDLPHCFYTSTTGWSSMTSQLKGLSRVRKHSKGLNQSTAAIQPIIIYPCIHSSELFLTSRSAFRESKDLLCLFLRLLEWAVICLESVIGLCASTIAVRLDLDAYLKGPLWATLTHLVPYWSLQWYSFVSMAQSWKFSSHHI